MTTSADIASVPDKMGSKKPVRRSVKLKSLNPKPKKLKDPLLRNF